MTDFSALYAAADKAGQDAVKALSVKAMVVGSAKGIFSNEIDYSKPTYLIEDGACGFAWINLKGNSAFGKWAKAAGKAAKDYPSGLSIWVSAFNQSLQKKEAYAYAFAKVLQDNGVYAVAGSRMD